MLLAFTHAAADTLSSASGFVFTSVTVIERRNCPVAADPPPPPVPPPLSSESDDVAPNSSVNVRKGLRGSDVGQPPLASTATEQRPSQKLRMAKPLIPPSTRSRGN